MASVQLRLMADKRAVARATGLVERFCKQHQIARAAAHAVAVSLDELISNIAAHSYKSKPGALLVALQYDPGVLSVVIEDHGAPFDPTQAKIPHHRGPLATRPVGGLGLLFVKKLMDDISYQRAGSINRLKLVKRLSR